MPTDRPQPSPAPSDPSLAIRASYRADMDGPEAAYRHACPIHVDVLAGISDEPYAYRMAFLDDAYMGSTIGKCETCQADGIYMWSETP